MAAAVALGDEVQEVSGRRLHGGQSGRARVPEVQPPESLAAALEALPGQGRRLLLDPFAEATVASLEASGATAFTLAVGPEGGWSANDRSALQAAGFTGIRLGPRVLRTETAGLAAVAALQARFGDLAA